MCIIDEAKDFAVTFRLPDDSGFILIVEDENGVFHPYGWCAQLPLTPFAAFNAHAVNLSSNSTLTRRGVGERMRWS